MGAEAVQIPLRQQIGMGGKSTPEGRTVVVVAGTPTKWRSLDRLQAREPGLVFLWCLDTAPKVLEYCHKLVPCVLIVDETFLAEVDQGRFSEVLELGRSIRVLVQSERDDPETVERILRLGCAGVLRSDYPMQTLRRAVRAVAEGELWASRKMLSRLMRELLLKERCGLTEREGEILRLVGQGYRNRDIAHDLFISPQTVRWHLRSLYAKLGVHSRRPELHAVGNAEQAPSVREGAVLAKRPQRATTAAGTGLPRNPGALPVHSAAG